ncbi:hypothetical protein JHK87_005275 [Glycine soja]|nr:hypothetical protein JHK87_005275 [Glycine soja]
MIGYVFCTKAPMASYYFLLLLVLVGATTAASEAELCTDFYSCTCPNLLPIVKKGVAKAIQKEPRMGASLLRLHFHHCFVNGCDAPILLDDTSNFVGEQTAEANNQSARGFNVINDIKANVEKECPRVVSCADILALAARDSVVCLGGPTWEVGLGRRASTTACRSDANNNIPGPFLSLSALINNFANQDLSVTDLVALSGVIIYLRCLKSGHIPLAWLNEKISEHTSTMIPTLIPPTESPCRASAPGVEMTKYSNPLTTKLQSISIIFQNLVSKKALLHSDQELFNSSSTDNLVRKYAANYCCIL